MGGGPAFSAVRDCGRFWISLFVLVAGFTLSVREPAQAQETPACTPAIARVVSLQGDVQVQRGGAGSWSSVRRLDTTVCAGDRLRVAGLSRAVLFVQPETLVRLDQNTTITLRQTAEETHVEVHADELAKGSQESKCCGAVYLITRFPKKFKVTTPHMNAAVEGTEFMVESSRDASKLTVFEGTVSSESATTKGRQLVSAGQSLAIDAAGQGAITAVVRPEDAVQWVLRYPQLSDTSDTESIPSASECRARQLPLRGDCLTRRAEALLRRGHVDEALVEMDAALAGDPTSGGVYSLRAVVQVAKNDKSAAIDSAQKAIAANPRDHRAWLALSYAYQASFKLEGARDAARKAQQLQPNSSLLQARVAELSLSLGYTREAEEAARSAIAADAAESHAYNVLGFVQLAQSNTTEARAQFEAAIERDSFAALPRLGLGLALIRGGRLTYGREQIEIALALDPGNSLLRSYIGKAYYEENTRQRDALAATQFDLATDLDPRDPTPHLYEAIRLQTSNRPVEALQEIRQSVLLNDNRAIYRSALKLDEDLAVRSASQGRIYRDLGFEQLAVVDGWKSVNGEPSDFSGHRLLADTYSRIPRHEFARVNELFVSQLLQPPNLTPVPPQLGEANLFILDTAGPSDIAFNEFNPLFNSDGRAIHASLTAGPNDTWGDDVSLAVLQGRWSSSLGQFHFESDGFRPNNDIEQDSYNLFAQFRESANTTYLTEVRASRREQGDLQLLFDPDNFDPNLREKEKVSSARVGIHHQFSPESELLASLVYQAADLSTSTTIVSIPALFEVKLDVNTYTAELQHILHKDRWRLLSGLRQEYREESEFDIFRIPPFPPFEFSEVVPQEFEFDSTSAYVYAYFDPIETVSLQVGATGHLLEFTATNIEQVDPKLGLTWEPSQYTRLHLAAARTVQPIASSRHDVPPRLEPTQVSGFNQVYSGVEGQSEWRYGVRLDHQVLDELFIGAEVSKRDIEFPILFVGEPGEPDQLFVVTAEEDFAQAYAFWTPADQFAFSARYQYDKRSNDEIGSGDEGFSSLRTFRIPLSVGYFHRAGLTIEARATYVDQSGLFPEFILEEPFVINVRDGDRFWVVDGAVRYRLPRRRGILALEAENMLDEEFRFQDVDPENPDFIPERIVSFKFTMAF